MEAVTMLILCSSLFTMIVVCAKFINKLYLKNEKIKSENEKLQSEKIELENKNKLEIEKYKKLKEDLISINPGDKALVPNWRLTWTDKKIDFQVTYEVEILEISADMIKVKGITLSSSDDEAMDPKNRTSLMRHMNEKWIEKNRIKPIINDSIRRNAKLEEILN